MGLLDWFRSRGGRLDSNALARSLWDMAGKTTGEIELAGTKIAVTSMMYAMAKSAQRREDLVAAKRSGHRINHRAAALDFFMDGLAVVAFEARSKGIPFEAWSKGCGALVDLYKSRLESIARRVDDGQGGEKIWISTFDSAATDLGAGVGHAFEDLVALLDGTLV